MGLIQVPSPIPGVVQNIQSFTSSTTWTVPSSAKYVDVMVVGGGTGGRGGKRATENSNYAGMGGAVTFVKDIFLNGTGTVSITVGAGSNGTTGTATTTNATEASNAGFSAFGTYCYSGGGIGNSRPGIPGYKGTASFTGTSYRVLTDTTQSNWAPSMAALSYLQRFYGMDNETNQFGMTFGINAIGFFGGYSGEAFAGSANFRNYAGGHPGLGESLGTTDVFTNTIPQAIPSTWLTSIGSATAGSSGTNGGTGGAAGISGVAGGGGTCKAVAGTSGGQGGAGGGGGGSWPNPVGGNGGNGGNAGTNTGAGGGAGANTGSTTAGTGGNGGNGAAGLVVVSWLS